MKSLIIFASLSLSLIAIAACTSDTDATPGSADSGASPGTDSGSGNSGDTGADTSTTTPPDSGADVDAQNTTPGAPKAVDVTNVKKLEYAKGAFGSVMPPKKITIDLATGAYSFKEADDGGLTEHTLTLSEVAEVKALLGNVKYVTKTTCSGFDGPVESLSLERTDNTVDVMTPGDASGVWVCSWSPDLDFIVTEGFNSLTAKLDALKN